MIVQNNLNSFQSRYSKQNVKFMGIILEGGSKTLVPLIKSKGGVIYTDFYKEAHDLLSPKIFFTKEKCEELADILRKMGLNIKKSLTNDGYIIEDPKKVILKEAEHQKIQEKVKEQDKKFLITHDINEFKKAIEESKLFETVRDIFKSLKNVSEAETEKFVSTAENIENMAKIRHKAVELKQNEENGILIDNLFGRFTIPSKKQ